jgi:hypothetical protein
MKKMAFFVEGQTEQAFVVALLNAVAGTRAVHIDAVKAFGGRVQPRAFLEVSATCRPNPEKRYYVIVFDSSNDSRVLSDIRDHYENLTAQGFVDIVGIRDVFPNAVKDIEPIRAAFTALAPSDPIVPTLVLAVMEIEAWFIGEFTHFARMHPRLTHTLVCSTLGYDPATVDTGKIPQPSEDLRKVYGLSGKGYNKSAHHVQRTVSNLDFAEIYVRLKRIISDLGVLVERIEQFLS